MSQQEPGAQPSSALHRAGGVCFVPRARLAEAVDRLTASRFVVVPPGGPLRRGHLGAALEEAVEGTLALRGALPPSVGAEADPNAAIRDRMRRVRALDRAGLAVVLPRLADATDSERRLAPSDSTALLTWAAVANAEPIVLIVDEADRAVRAWAPIALESLWGDGSASDDEPERGTVPAPTPGATSDHGTVAGEPEPQARGPWVKAEADAQPESEPHAEQEVGAPARRVVNAAEWRAYAVELDAARGPKPARAIDKLFATRYVPLLGAVARGEADLTVRSVVDAWRASFEHSYRESFAALRVTGKRPSMVLDAPDVAAKIARQSGARSVKLVLVDSLSFDLGERLAERLAERVAGRALCVERHLLWSSLPTTTPAQLALLARGAEALRDAPPSEREPDVSRGRAVSTLRRERVGQREIMKLDTAEARLRTAGPAYDERLDAIAEEIAAVIARYVEGLPARTLLFVFGDHGFRLPATADGRATGAAVQGGASPEEVLVPGYAWLVGGVH